MLNETTPKPDGDARRYAKIFVSGGFGCVLAIVALILFVILLIFTPLGSFFMARPSS